MEKLTAVGFAQLWKEAEQGNAQAQFMLANALYNGNGRQRDPIEGARWLLRAAEQGYAPAQCDLGAMYLKGVGVKQDYDEAIKWLEKAAQQNDAVAQHNLGSVYAKGFRDKSLGFFKRVRAAHGTLDYVEAYKWFTLAAKNGYSQSLRDRALIAKMWMRVSEIEYAERLAREFAAAQDRHVAQEWYAPSEETYYVIFKDGACKKVHIQEASKIEAYVEEANRDFYGDNPIVRIVSQALQEQRLACGRDGTVWPKVPAFYVHFDDGVVSILNLKPNEVHQWAKLMGGGKHKIVAICDEYAYVIWPARDGSKIFAS